MIRVVSKPECFSNIEDNHVFYELSNDVGVYGYLALYMSSEAVLHLEVIRFTASVYKEMVNDWQVVKNIIKQAGCKKVIALGSEKNTLWDKFVKLFGFGDSTLLKMSIMEV